MNINDAIKQHERIQELLDRRTRLLEDLVALDEEIAEAFSEMKEEGGTMPEQRALPPAGATGQTGSAKPRSRKKPKSEKSSKRATADTVRGPILKYFKKHPGQSVTSADVVAATGLETKQAQNGILNLYKTGELERLGRGEYRLKK